MDMNKNTINERMKTMPKGFRFYPTEEELLTHYLKLKMDGKDSEVENVISEVDICRYDPWDLPSKSAVESHDQEWFFFSPCNYKYKKSRRLNRTTDRGYWKPTGKDIKVKAKGKVIGIKKHLVYHIGKFPNGDSTSWVIHEYHSSEIHPYQKAFVLCRLKRNPSEDIDKGSTSGDTASGCGNLTAQIGTLEDRYQCEEGLSALMTTGSPTQRYLISPFLSSLEHNQPELCIQEHQSVGGIISDYNGPEIPSDMGEDEIDISEFLNPVIFEQCEGSEITFFEHKLVKPACFLSVVEGSPSGYSHDHLKEGRKDILSNKHEKSDSSSDDSYTHTPRFILLGGSPRYGFHGNLVPVSSEDKKAGEAADIHSYVDQPMKRDIILYSDSDHNIGTNKILARKLKSSSYNSEGSNRWASFIVYDTPLLRQKCKPPFLYFLNCLIGITLFIIIFRDMMLYG